MKKNSTIFMLLIWCTTIIFAQQQHHSVAIYGEKDELPDCGEFLPGPPDITSYKFSDDSIQWRWGKSLKDTERGKKASDDSNQSIDYLADIFGDAIDLEISEQNTPYIYSLVKKVAHTGGTSVQKAKSKYKRTRPFKWFDDEVWTEYDNKELLLKNGSYPSGHTAKAFTIALTLAQVVPERENEVIKCGIEYGKSRIIAGVHWQSDVDAGMLSAAATYSYMQSIIDFDGDVAAARFEYARKKHKQDDPEFIYPDITQIIGGPVDVKSPRFRADSLSYEQGKDERSTARGDQAVIDGDPSLDNQLKLFSECVDVEINQTNTPKTYELMKLTRKMLKKSNKQSKSAYFRARPFVQFNEPSGTPQWDEEAKDESSYPSGHSCVGWGEAMVLSEVMPAFKNEILKRGYEYGRSRVILGYHYATDVDASRYMASATVAIMHTDSEFRQALNEAMIEYLTLDDSVKKHDTPTGVSEAAQAYNEQKAKALEGWYTLIGAKLPAKPSQPGIYLHNGEKELVK